LEINELRKELADWSDLIVSGKRFSMSFGHPTALRSRQPVNHPTMLRTHADRCPET
jgi:hypothetical protein